MSSLMPCTSLRRKAPRSRFSRTLRSGEDEAAFGHLRDAQADDLVRGQLVDGLAVPEDLALARPVDAADGHERGGLAGAVGTDEGHDLAVIHAQGNVAQGLDVAVVGINALDFKHLRFLPDRPE